MLQEIGLVDAKTGALDDLVNGNHSFAKQFTSNSADSINDPINDPEKPILKK